MKLLITGACGHIGSYLVTNINKIKKLKEIILIDNFNAHRYHTLFNISKKKISFFKIDLSKKNLNKFKKLIMLFIVHLIQTHKVVFQ